MEVTNNNATTELKQLTGKKIQINFINKADESDTVSGRLLSVTNDLIIIDGSVMKTQLYRKHIQIVSIDYVEEPEGSAVMKLIVSKDKAKMTKRDWMQIGEMIEHGITSGKDNPKGIDWELVSWRVLPNDKRNTR
jgi:hypothetical protein